MRVGRPLYQTRYTASHSRYVRVIQVLHECDSMKVIGGFTLHKFQATQAGPAGREAKGSILSLRMGINPNSSGYGIIFGAMFFLPYSVVGSLLTGVMASAVDAALERYRHAQDVAERGKRAVVPILWGLAWTGFCAAWSVFLSQILMDVSPWLCGCISVLVAGPITYLAYTRRTDRCLMKMTGVVTTMGLVGLFAGVVFLLPFLANIGIFPGLMAFPEFRLGFVVMYSYSSPLALALTGVGLRMAGVLRNSLAMWLSGIIYVVLGTLFIIPLLPVSPPLSEIGYAYYNTVGLFFPLWGWGVPALLSAYSLFRLGRERDEDPENPL